MLIMSLTITQCLGHLLYPRFDPMIESHLENLHHQAIASQIPRDALVATWQDPISGSLHFTDVVSMTDATDARPNAAREARHIHIYIYKHGLL